MTPIDEPSCIRSHLDSLMGMRRLRHNEGRVFRHRPKYKNYPPEMDEFYPKEESWDFRGLDFPLFK